MWYIYKTVMKYVAELEMCSNINCNVPFSRYIHSYKSGIWCDHRVLYLNILFCNLKRVISISYIYIYIYKHTFVFFSFSTHKNDDTEKYWKSWKSYSPWRKMKTTQRKRSVIRSKTSHDKWYVFSLAELSVIFSPPTKGYENYL